MSTLSIWLAERGGGPNGPCIRGREPADVDGTRAVVDSALDAGVTLLDASDSTPTVRWLRPGPGRLPRRALATKSRSSSEMADTIGPG
ncbi:MAG: hypothetical protein ACRDZQ_00585 [Acidimicrobiales bacterium]